jgi:hypothetical protein
MERTNRDLSSNNGNLKPSWGPMPMLAAVSPYAVGQYPHQIVAADFNEDGKLDLATANLSDGTVSILLQQ